MSTSRCPHCGVLNREGSNFCNNCGTALDMAAIHPQEDDARTPSRPSAIPPATEQRDTPVEAEAEPTPLQPDARFTQLSQQILAAPPHFLQPIAIAQTMNQPPDDAGRAERPGIPYPAINLTDAQIRTVRQLMTDDPLLADILPPATGPEDTNLRVPWLFWVIAVALTLPVLTRLIIPGGAVQEWTGVRAAFTAIQTLPTEATVLVWWAYDPATAGEMDMVVQPVVQHLIEQRSQLIIVSPLPTGPATARRRLAQAARAMSPDSVMRSPPQIAGGYLPGGATTMPLLGQNVPAALWSVSVLVERALGDDDQPELALVVAAQAEDVQQWLEQVQPLNHVPVIAVVGAGADPILRPYLDSGQLAGLVSGFDGAITYQTLAHPTLTASADSLLFLQRNQQWSAQNVGQLTVIVLIVLGNLAALIRRSNRG